MLPYLTHKEKPRPYSATGFRDHIMEMKVKGQVPGNNAPTGGGKSATLQPNKSSVSRTSSSRSSKFFILKKSKKTKKIEPSSTEKTTPAPAYLLPAPPKGGFMNSEKNTEETVYDLFAVSNHLGDMNRGHYISYCKNPVESKWFIYDDQNVVPIQSEDQVITQHAYILFYIRRGAKLKLPGAMLNHMNTHNIVERHHWINTIPKYSLDLAQLNAYESMRASSRRQASTVSAQPVFSDSGVSPPNASGGFFGPPASTAAYSAHSVVSAPPLYRTQHGSNDTDGAGYVPNSLTNVQPSTSQTLPPPPSYAFQPHANHTLQIPTGHALPTLPLQTLNGHTLPPHSVPTPTSPATVLSQGTSHTHSTNHAPNNYLRRRAGSFHGTTRFGIGVSKQTADGHTSTRL